MAAEESQGLKQLDKMTLRTIKPGLSNIIGLSDY